MFIYLNHLYFINAVMTLCCVWSHLSGSGSQYNHDYGPFNKTPPHPSPNNTPWDSRQWDSDPNLCQHCWMWVSLILSWEACHHLESIRHSVTTEWHQTSHPPLPSTATLTIYRLIRVMLHCDQSTVTLSYQLSSDLSLDMLPNKLFSSHQLTRGNKNFYLSVFSFEYYSNALCKKFDIVFDCRILTNCIQ